MTTPLDSMYFYTKLLTGLILLLNIGLLVAIQMALKFAKRNVVADPSEKSAASWAHAKRALAALILIVVTVNASAIYANHRVMNATRDIAATLPDSESGLVVNLSK